MELTSIDSIEELVAGRVRQVPCQRISGEFRAAHDLGDRLHRRWPNPSWIGKILQFSDDSTLLLERDLVAEPERLRVIDRYAVSHLAGHLVELSGQQLEMEVEPVLSSGGALKLKLWRVLCDHGPGCWTQEKASQRDMLAGLDRAWGPEGSSLEITSLPRQITVIAPRQGTASRSDMTKILVPPKVPEHVRVNWPTGISFIGADAPRQIAAAVREADVPGNLILIARGGGGRPDFWPFETAVVGRAIQECRCQVLIALGHGENKTLADELASHSFDVPQTAAKAVADACGRVQGARGKERAWQKRRNVEERRNEEPERQKRELDQSLRAVIAERDGLQQKLAAAELGRQNALAARNRAQADLGEAILRALEPAAGLDAVTRMRDAVHLRYISAFPVLLGAIFAYLCIIDGEGASRVVWGGCAVLYAGTSVASWVGAQHLTRRARELVSPGS